MDTEKEMVGVEVSFWGRKVFPIRFVWRGRRHEIKRVTGKFERSDGGRRYLCFGVDTGGMVAELAMDKDDLSWRIYQCEPSYI